LANSSCGRSSPPTSQNWKKKKKKEEEEEEEEKKKCAKILKFSSFHQPVAKFG